MELENRSGLRMNCLVFNDLGFGLALAGFEPANPSRIVVLKTTAFSDFATEP